MWVAKGKYSGKVYGKPFKDIYDCQSYIDNCLQLEMEAERINKYRHYIKDYDQITDEHEKHLAELVVECNVMCNPILCYNVNQCRFCDGFDF